MPPIVAGSPPSSPPATKVFNTHKDEDEDGDKAEGGDFQLCRGMLVKVHAEGESGWRPFPWGYVPDRALAVFSAAWLLIIGPPMAVLIFLVVSSYEGVRKIGAYCGRLSKLRDSLAQKVANRIMLDPRNAPYLPYMLFVGLWAPSLFLWALHRHTTHGFEWWLFFAYHLLRLGPRYRFFASVQVLVHKEGHDKKGFFKGPFRVFNYVNQWFLGPFYGQVPMTYETGHNKIHHRFDNGLEDVHTNLDLDRSEPYALLLYLPRFALYWSGLSCLLYFVWKKEWSLARRAAAGFFYFHGVLLALLCWNWQFALAYCIYPYTESILFFCLISYLWHAFMDPNDPSNDYVNSITILEGHDNIWNEDYHVVHHVSPCHWTEYPAHFARNKHNYAASKATIFRDCEEGLLLGWMLTKDWDQMVKHFVDLDGKMTDAEKKALLLSRLRSTLSPASVAPEETKKGA